MALWRMGTLCREMAIILAVVAGHIALTLSSLLEGDSNRAAALDLQVSHLPTDITHLSRAGATRLGMLSGPAAVALWRMGALSRKMAKVLTVVAGHLTLPATAISL
eukprot:CAMPEP_0184311840 /NCGR_PEP_ID=MMETSP1049-20130417/45800_1 /TAXON_ID=77928 /ORGANISM="Proteomonas sulcata, Strain CCMP704" /LENGTH=105 /DNA_ID=CAMNT_0026627563 /DNA_START=242 /DNA_END=556 /DNA_ORIENTATION=-